MARRKRAHHKTTSRRRHSRVSGIGKNAFTHVAAVIGGAVAAKFIGKMLEGKLNEKMLAGAQIALGVFLPKFVKGAFGEGMGAGMVATGGVSLVTSLGVLKGIGAMEDGYQMEFISGVNDITTISGEDEDHVSGDMSFATSASNVGELSVLAGFDEQE